MLNKGEVLGTATKITEDKRGLIVEILLTWVGQELFGSDPDPDPATRVDEVGGEGGYLTMADVHGFVMFDDNVIGTFVLDADEKISVEFHNTFTSVSEMLEVSAEQGMSFALMANAECNDYLPKHYQEV